MHGRDRAVDLQQVGEPPATRGAGALRQVGDARGMDLAVAREGEQMLVRLAEPEPGDEVGAACLKALGSG